LAKYFGSVPKGMISLFAVITSGTSWSEIAWALMEVAWYNVLFLLMFVVFMILGVLNVVTSAFVSDVMDRAENEKEIQLDKIQQQRIRNERDLNNVFDEIDVDDSGQLDIEEVEALQQNEEASGVFERMGIGFRDAWRFFDMLDEDKSRTLSRDEFVNGCLRLSSSANNTSMAVLLSSVSRIQIKLSRLEALAQGERRESRVVMQRSSLMEK